MEDRQTAISDSHIKVAGVVENDDAHVDDVDDLHPLVDHDAVAFLRERSFEVDIYENNNIESEICRY